MQKTIEDLKRKNSLLQKKVANDDDGLSVVSKDYEDVIKGTLSQITPRESYEIYKNPEPQSSKAKEPVSKNISKNDHAEEEEEEEYDEENYSQDSDKNSANSV